MARTTRGKRILAAVGIALLTASGIGGAAHAAPAQSQSTATTAHSSSIIVHPAFCCRVPCIEVCIHPK